MIEYLKEDWKEIGKIKFKKKGEKPIDIVYKQKTTDDNPMICWVAEYKGNHYGTHVLVNDKAIDKDLSFKRKIQDCTIILEQHGKATLEAIIKQSDEKETKDSSNSEQSKGLAKTRSKTRKTKAKPRSKD